MGKNSWDMSYTRHKYISSVPQSRINIFTLGDSTEEYEYSISLVASTNVQISSRALESARVATNRFLTGMLGERSFLLNVIPYPHEVIREHKFMGFAGADRISRGMTKAFGRPTRRVARVNKGQEILTVSVDKDGVDAAKKALKRASKKLPVKYTVEVKKANPIVNILNNKRDL